MDSADTSWGVRASGHAIDCHYQYEVVKKAVRARMLVRETFGGLVEIEIFKWSSFNLMFSVYMFKFMIPNKCMYIGSWKTSKGHRSVYTNNFCQKSNILTIIWLTNWGYDALKWKFIAEDVTLVYLSKFNFNAEITSN